MNSGTLFVLFTTVSRTHALPYTAIPLFEKKHSIHSSSTTQERGRRREKEGDKRSMRERRERYKEEFTVRRKLNVIGGKLQAIH